MASKIICPILVACVCLLLWEQAGAGGAVSDDDLVRLERLAIGGDFALTDQDGRRFDSSEHRGKVLLLFFGYTSCAEACPIILSRVKSVYKLLGAEKDRFLAVFVSLDPARDTSPVLKEYMNHFSVKAVGLTGRKEEIDRVVALFGAKYEIERSDSALGYHINHTTSLFLIDRKGKTRYKFNHTDRPELIASGVRQLIR